ncbi:MAG: DRTGG domain-containing protein [Syntrophales bacterium]|jgi:predicted transcriptional regulator|nr:DRTGG domain-containing protein [Syntrophales bacterium]MCK9527837.1 DRTGG domain-containing protein [Syntrophales bacterium]MDX9922066.1 DRTGG domain-containing protein [Syntrophales bacterium]
MTLAEVIRKLNLGVRCCDEKLDRGVEGGYVGDLLSDVIANSKKGHLWITRQSHQNIVAVASLREHAGIILTLGKEPDRETLEKATREGIPILVTDLPGFEIAGRLYGMIAGEQE